MALLVSLLAILATMTLEGVGASVRSMLDRWLGRRRRPSEGASSIQSTRPSASEMPADLDALVGGLRDRARARRTPRPRWLRRLEQAADAPMIEPPASTGRDEEWDAPVGEANRDERER